jgi:hypothetical protein
MLKTMLVDHTHFNEIAKKLLNDSILHVNGIEYKLCEIEFYYHNGEHKDMYTHCSKEQNEKCKFYFHKFHSGTYKSGTYKGMDITLSPNKDTYFGILVRSIMNIKTNEFIEGPCRVVNKILEHFGCKEVYDFVRDKKIPLDIYDETTKLYIIDCVGKFNDEIYKGIRIGLSDKYPEFQIKKYRFATNINKIKKQRKTFSKM